MKCNRCGLEKAEPCLNGNVLNEDRSQARMCPNLAKALKYEAALKRIHPMARDARLIKSSPLFTPKVNVACEPGVDLTRNNLYIQGITWGQFLPHLKLIQLCKDIKVRVITDEEIRSVFVGNDSYKAKPASKRETVETLNNLPELMSRDYDLVIIRVGFLGYKNISAAGAFREGLMYRAGHSKPTWIFESSHKSVIWRYSKDEDLEHYLTNYREIHLTSADPPIEDLTGLTLAGPELSDIPSEYNSAVPGDDDVSLPEPAPRQRTKVVTNLEDEKPSFQSQSGSFGADSLLNIGNDRKKFPKRKGGF